MIKIKLLAALAAGALALPAMAQTQTPNQGAPVKQGAQSGQLTPKETAKLEKAQKVAGKEAKANKKRKKPVKQAAPAK